MSKREARRLVERDRYVRNLLAVYQRAKPTHLRDGANWYRLAYARCADMARTHGFPVEAVVYALAALSPLQPWEKNVKDTHQVVRAIRHKRRAPVVTFRRQVNIASQCLRGALGALSGPKVSAFAAAILGDTSAPVIDTWMLRAAGWDRPYSPKPGGMYNTLGEALTLAANVARLEVTTFQATVWLTVRAESGQ